MSRVIRLIRSIWRFIRGFVTFFPFLVIVLRDRRRFIIIGRSRTVDPDGHRRRATRLLDSLIRLGPTFIKLGQLLSTRPDILPPAYIEVMSQLQDEVPPAPWSKAKSVVEDEIGPIPEHFDSFDTDAISGASLGQVYRAEVDGEAVAVKVRRPGVENLVESDLIAIRWTLRLLLPFVDESRAFSVRNLADEFERTIRQEMDYNREGAMMEEIKANFADDPDIIIPGRIDSHSGETVLTMPYEGGTKITEVDELRDRGIDTHAVARRLQLAYFKMIVDDGTFHADPHPGNLAVKDDGSIVFYDFGMSGRVSPYVRERIVEFYIGVVNRDTDAILDALIAIGTLGPEADRDVMGDLIEVAIEDARGREVDQYRVQQVVSRIEDSIYEFPFRLPAHLALVIRVATVVEGVCVTLDPEYDFVEVASEYLIDQGYREEGVRRYLEETGDELIEAAVASTRIPPKLEDTLDRIERQNFRVEANVIDDDRTLQQMTARLILGLALTGTIIATAVLYSFADTYATVVAAIIGLGIALLLIRSFRQRRGITARPQFTRQSLYRRREEE